MKNILFEQKRIKLLNKCHFIENKKEIKHYYYYIKNPANFLVA
jgi:hypothetical protein